MTSRSPISLRRIGPAALTAALAALTACSPMLSSVQPPNQPVQDGLAYYLPRQPLKLTVTITMQGDRAPTVDLAPVLPDYTRRFRLRYDPSPLAKTKFTVGVSTFGLLTTTDASAMSGVGDILANLSQALGDVTAAAAKFDAPPPAATGCIKGQTYSRLVFPEHPDLTPLCGYTLAIAPLQPGLPTDIDTARVQAGRGAQSGVFYKQARPYLVTFTDTFDTPPEPPRQFVASSPDESPVLFMPVRRGFFADNDTKLMFTDGMLINVDASTQGEAIAASAIPAKVLEAYFHAIGATFGTLGMNASAQTTIVADQEQRSLAIAKQQICARTIATNPTKGVTGDALQTALTAIAAACS